MRIASLRLRLLLLAAVSIAVMLSLSGFALIVIFERHVERRVEDELRVRWDELAAALTVDIQGRADLAHALSDPRYQRPLSGAYWQVSDAAGPVMRSRSLWDEVLPDARADTEGRAVEREGPNDSELYIIDRDIARAGGGSTRHFRLAVALDHAEINALRDSFVGDTTAALAILGVILLVGAAGQASIGLRPLRLLRGQLADVQTGRAARLAGDFPDEVAPLATSLNLLLDQQEQQVVRARERAGDLAHGLKTPLTILAAEARRLEEGGERDGAATLREQVAFMRAHVERELARARTRGASASRGVATDLAASAAKLVDLLGRVGEGDRLDWVVAVPPALRIRMDPHDVSEVLGNLLDNARKWARSRVVVTASGSEDAAVVVAVVDDGPGIPDAHRARLVERGERGSLAVEGDGLGLSIVSGVLESYGAVLTLSTPPDGGCSASFSIDGWFATAAAAPGRDARSTKPTSAGAGEPGPQAAFTG